LDKEVRKSPYMPQILLMAIANIERGAHVIFDKNPKK